MINANPSLTFWVTINTEMRVKGLESDALMIELTGFQPVVAQLAHQYSLID